MFEKINQIFNFNQNALNLYSKRQEILASNIANADTPMYKAMDINFQNELNRILDRQGQKNTNITLKITSPNHLNPKHENLFLLKMMPVTGQKIKPDGNTVNMDRERVEFLNNSLKYESSLMFIKNEIKNMIHILQG